MLTPHHLLDADQTQEGMGGEEAQEVDIEESVLVTSLPMQGVNISGCRITQRPRVRSVV